MEIPSTTEQPRKVKNFLIRYSCAKEIKPNSFSHHPEKSHLLKYFPKYYKNLALEVTSQNPLLLKIKRIKKLETFTGALKQKFPFAFLRTLLGNNKKSIEEIPKVICERSKIGHSKPFWVKLTDWKVKFFPNIKRLILPKRKPDDYRFEDSDDFLFSRRFLMNKYIGNMRNLKILEFYLRDVNNEGVKWMLEKLDGMEKFMKKLDNLRMEVDDDSVNIQELFKNKRVISNLTGLRFLFNLIKLDPVLMKIPETCKKLRSLSMGFRGSVDEDPEFSSFLTGLQSLPLLVNLEFFWPGRAQNFWTYFKPKASLRSLKLRFDVSDLANRSDSLQDLFKNWEDINEMDEIEFTLSCDDVKDLFWVKMFITMVLGKVRKLCSFKCLIFTSLYLYFNDPTMSFEPFSVEQVPHLYESLQRFEFGMKNLQYCPDVKFDLKKMNVFKNLKETKLEGKRVVFENIEEMVSLLEEGQTEGDYPLLELQLEPGCEIDWFKETMEKIYKAKRKDRSLKIIIDLSDRVDHMAGGELKFLGELCDSIQSVGLIRGLFVNFEFSNVDEDCYLEVEDLKEIVNKYGEIRNLVVKMLYFRQRWEYRRLEGEKKEFLLKNGKNVL